MKMSPDGIELLKRLEGFSAKAYPDPGTGAEPYTIGYGHTKGVRNGDQTDVDQASRWLQDDVNEAVSAIQDGICVVLEQNQIDSLVSFVFNVGVSNFFKSTLLKMINAQDFTGAADQFLRWNRAGGHEMAGLTKRREEERELFNTA